MSSHLVVKEDTQVSTQHPDWSKEQVELIKNQIAKDATTDELKLFLYHAKKTGLDPLAKQIYFQKRNSNVVFITSIDGYRLIAARTGEHAGTDDAIFDNEEEPAKATVTVYRIVGGQRVAFTASARWSEYCPQPPKDFLWKKMPCTMLSKCAESLALRKAFPNELSGMYTDTEMEQADQPIRHGSVPTKVQVNPVSTLTQVTDAQRRQVWAKVKSDLKYDDIDAKNFLKVTTHKDHSQEWTTADIEKILVRIEEIKNSNPQAQHSVTPDSLIVDSDTGGMFSA